MATVQLHIALLGPSCAPKASDKDIEKHLEEFDPSDTEDEVNVNRLLVWFGKLNKLLGVSVVAHWLLETHGHYFELGKPSLGKSAFRKGVPVKSVKWDREERIFQSFDVGTTNCTIGQINDIGERLMQAEHYNGAIMNCQTEIKKLAKEIIAKYDETKWPVGSEEFIYYTWVAMSVAGIIAHIRFGAESAVLGFITTGSIVSIPLGARRIYQIGIEFYHDVINHDFLTACINATRKLAYSLGSTGLSWAWETSKFLVRDVPEILWRLTTPNLVIPIFCLIGGGWYPAGCAVAFYTARTGLKWSFNAFYFSAKLSYNIFANLTKAGMVGVKGLLNLISSANRSKHHRGTSAGFSGREEGRNNDHIWRCRTSRVRGNGDQLVDR